MNGLDEMITNEFLNYWGLERLPFPKVCDPANTFFNNGYEQALKRLNQLMYTREIGVVIGEAGNGKSTLLDIFLSKVSSTRYKVILVSVPQNKPRELYRAISAAMGVNTSWFGADALKVVDLLTYSYIESNRPNLILIDEAYVLTPATLNELRLLTNTKVKNEPLITLMLFGQPALSSTLKLPAMIPQRGTASNLTILRPLAAKTGTTTDNRDAYLVAYTPEVVVSFWMGHAFKAWEGSAVEAVVP